jgi:hypothetical protein
MSDESGGDRASIELVLGGMITLVARHGVEWLSSPEIDVGTVMDRWVTEMADLEDGESIQALLTHLTELITDLLPDT